MKQLFQKGHTLNNGRPSPFANVARSVRDGKKRCTKCGELKDTIEFSLRKARGRPPYLRSQCRKCHVLTDREWRKRNPEKVKLANRRPRKPSNRSSKERTARWRARNPEKIKESRRASWRKYKAEHPEIGTLDNPRRDTKFKKGDAKLPGAGILFAKGHTINAGRPCWRKGLPLAEDTKLKIKASLTGRKVSIETRLKMSLSGKARREQSHLWKGGITEESKRLRNSFEYKLWREAVFTRDNWTCQDCGRRGCQLQADHIKPFAYHPELRFKISNGRTLCVDCHKKTDTYLGKAQQYAKILNRQVESRVRTEQ